jgi:glucosyl-dolichyl phosphate glucuronosyltransferase
MTTRLETSAQSRRASPSISVVICAYTERRWDDVLAAVTSVRAQDVAPHEIIVVVDHNAGLYERLKAALGDIVVVPNQHEPGLSGGKNTGVDTARGELVAFLDDDAIAEPTWLKYLGAAYVDQKVLGVGGLTRPLWEDRRPSWFPEEFDWVVGCTFVGREPGPVRNLLGGNASFRREAFDIVGGFPTHIGRSSSSRRPLGCEETEFCIRLARSCPGAVYVFDARAVIWHKVSRARSRFSYFRSRCYAEGLSKALVTRSVGIADGLAAERRYTAVTLRRGVSRGVAHALRGEPAALARSAAITVGLLSTTSGYGVGMLQTRPRRRHSRRVNR